MKKSIVQIRQPWWFKILNLFIYKSNEISEIELDDETWFDNEGEFVWSHPNAKIKLSNIDSLYLILKCPVGRDIVIKTKCFKIKKTLKKDRMYTFSINTSNLDEIFISTTPYVPNSDNRELGLCFYNISEKL